MLNVSDKVKMVLASLLIVFSLTGFVYLFNFIIDKDREAWQRDQQHARGVCRDLHGELILTRHYDDFIVTGCRVKQ